MCVRPARNSTQEETRWHDCIAGEGEGFLDGDDRQVEEVSEHVEAEKHGGCVCRNEIDHKVCSWMVIMSCEGEGGLERMVPGLVLFGGEMVSRMEDIAVDNIY